jgi:hypothetical protein
MERSKGLAAEIAVRGEGEPGAERATMVTGAVASSRGTSTAASNCGLAAPSKTGVVSRTCQNSSGASSQFQKP